MTAKENFVRQQGFRDVTSEACDLQYPALMWQPRVLGVLLLAGLLFPSWIYFTALSGLLVWSAAAPLRNPFDALYNRLIAAPRGLPPLGPAPAPRRFAMAFAATFLLVIGLSMLAGAYALAGGLFVLLLAALAALIFGRFCLGSYLYLHFTGQAAFANRTLPWSRSE